MRHPMCVIECAALAGCLALGGAASAESQARLSWSELPQLPPAPGQQKQIGVAGPFAGEHNGAFIVAGGANFPGRPPWDGGSKVWWDDVFVLKTAPDGTYQWLTDKRHKLPRPLAYGVSIPTSFGLVCIGGCDADQCYTDVFALQWNLGRQGISVEPLPPLPQPLAFMSGALVGGTIYVAGGQEAMKDATATRHFLALDLSARNDPTDFKWRELPAWPGPPRILPIAVAQSDRFYLFSGRNIAPGRATGLLTDAYSYDPASANWTPVANIAAGGEPRCVMAGTGIASGADRVLIFGGASAAMFRGLEQLSSAIQWTPNEADAEVLKKKQRRILENHPGFSRDILSYNTVTDTWRKLGEFPTTSHVTTTATRWGEWIVIPSGEIRPGVRTPKLWKASESVPTDGADTRQ